ncbi:MAG TPA: hypothetical protein VFY29_02555 [Terriglobia bacterium]|nr:hypothetical protein [Terriglobia bacterium]
MKATLAILLGAGVFAGSVLALAQRPATAGIPVREVSIFKDGHAFLLHQGAMPVDASGVITMDYLPSPLLGTFWAYSADPGVGISSMTAGQGRVAAERPALNLADLLQANVGAEVLVTEKPGAAREAASYPATILGVPQRSALDEESSSRQNFEAPASVRGDVILLRTSEGVKATPLDRIQDVLFKSTPRTTIAREESRNLLTLTLDWKNRPATETAEVGLVYLQKGLRWIPNYRVTIDGKGSANVKLQATIINEITDLTDVTANLIVGVPSFAFKDILDPLSLQQSVALSSYFQTNDRTAASNALVSQVGFGARAATPPAVDLGPVDAGQNEDLFLFTLRHLALRKGQRMNAPVAEYSFQYKDVYTLALPFGPPEEIQAMSGARGNMPADQQAELARLLGTPKPAHKIRIRNTANAPLTTATALIMENDRILSQGMMTYTPAGGSVDLESTSAVDIQVTKSETEAGRAPNVMRINNQTLSRVDMSGSVRLTNYRKDAVEVEVVRDVLGEATEADHGGLIQKLNTLENDRPSWWRYYNWPNWWNQANGVGRIVWQVTIPPGGSVDLKYTWRYLWA